MNEHIFCVLSVLMAYLIGAIPTGYIIARLCGIRDITQHGSGNIGATNVARVLGKQFFVLVLLLDGVKAFLVVTVAQYFFDETWIIALISFSILIGNCYSLFLRGRGGKGVATSIGIMLSLNPQLFLFQLCVWVLGFILFRVVGIASIISAISLVCASLFMQSILLPYRFLYGAMGLLAFVRHDQNVRRYIQERRK
ncbi:MAG: glycerol-3-phosphate 1-O-acyltransferase PlsY [Candidatus Babeliales bacterium]